MKDIRIIHEKRITPSLDTVLNLLGGKSRTSNRTELIKLFEKHLPEVKMHIRPKAVITMERIKENEFPLLYIIVTLGDAISGLIQKYTDKEDILSAMVIDAMADSCLFAFEEQLLPIIRKMCLEEGYGIARRLEMPVDIPFEMQMQVYEAVDAKRTLGMSITSGYMLEPVKSMSLIFELTEDITCGNLEHDCGKCMSKECPFRKFRFGAETFVP